MKNLDSISETIRAELNIKDEAREKMLPLSRDAIRCCSQAIRAIHRQEFEDARDQLKQAEELIAVAAEAISKRPELVGSGAHKDAQKELAEGYITLAIVTGEELPEPAQLSVDGAAYLNGMGEAVGEVRRYLLDALRRGDLSRGEELLGAMDDIYSALVTFDYPDAVTGGLRRTTDMVRGVLERTRSDLTLTIQQKRLEDKIELLEKEQ